MQIDRRILAERFPAMSYRTPGSGALRAEGSVTIEAPMELRKTVRLRITFPRSYSRRAPAAHLTGRDFYPRERRHFMTDDGSCCLYLPGVNDAWDAEDPYAFGPWLDQVALFITRQMFFDELGYWPGPEWQHGEAAYLQHVTETLNDDAFLVAAFFEHRRRGTSSETPCACGSGDVFRDCHFAVFEKLKSQIAGRRESDIKAERMSQTAPPDLTKSVRARAR